RAPRRWERWFLIAAVLLQQAAFIPLPEELMDLEAPLDAFGNAADPARSNPLNFGLTLACLVILGILSLARLRALVATIKQNPLVAATVVLALASVLWSFDPALSLRRAGTYSLGVLLALYLVQRLSFEAIVRLVALSITLPAVGSLIYAVLVPDLAYMQSPGLAGSLRGVYSHKNQLANVMALGVMLQLYLALTTGHRLRHLALAAFQAFLVLQAHSASFTVSLGLFVGVLALYRFGRFSHQLAMLAILAGTTFVIALGIAAIQSPDEIFGLLGRDATLTGRTVLWPTLPAVIAEHPVLGWGYAAFWQSSNEAMLRIWAQVGWQPPHAHNGLLEVAIDFGLVGVVLAVAIMVRFAIDAVRATRLDAGYKGWVYWSIIAYTVFNNTVEITLLRTQEFAWFTFLVLFMTCAARQHAVGRAALPAAPTVAVPSIVARAKPLPRAKDGVAS
ncbi:MAG: O-antigen ligase family protein, partial [Proteobacteria bacterium]|nr:O-antigen ligase family protein [Pseudomonadota bacterium]